MCEEDYDYMGDELAEASEARGTFLYEHLGVYAQISQRLEELFIESADRGPSVMEDNIDEATAELRALFAEDPSTSGDHYTDEELAEMLITTSKAFSEKFGDI